MAQAEWEGETSRNTFGERGVDDDDDDDNEGASGASADASRFGLTRILVLNAKKNG